MKSKDRPWNVGVRNKVGTCCKYDVYLGNGCRMQVARVPLLWAGIIFGGSRKRFGDTHANALV